MYKKIALWFSPVNLRTNLKNKFEEIENEIKKLNFQQTKFKEEKDKFDLNEMKIQFESELKILKELMVEVSKQIKDGILILYLKFS